MAQRGRGVSVKLMPVQDMAVVFEREHEEAKVEACKEHGRELMELHYKIDCNMIILNELLDNRQEVCCCPFLLRLVFSDQPSFVLSVGRSLGRLSWRGGCRSWTALIRRRHTRRTSSGQSCAGRFGPSTIPMSHFRSKLEVICRLFFFFVFARVRVCWPCVPMITTTKHIFEAKKGF